MYFIRQADVQNMNETWKVALKCFAPIHKILKVTSQMASASDNVVLVWVVPLGKNSVPDPLNHLQQSLAFIHR